MMRDDKTVMIGEKSDAHHYKLNGGVIEDGATHVAMFSPCGEVASSGCSK